MKIKHKKPPNYSEIIKHFPIVANMCGVIFTYGDVLYNPDNGVVPDDLMAHEETHTRQQKKMGIENWWKHYFDYPEFRLQQELEAYRVQYQYAVNHYGRKLRRRILQDISTDLSRPMYGNIIKKKEAMKLIKE